MLFIGQIGTYWGGKEEGGMLLQKKSEGLLHMCSNFKQRSPSGTEFISKRQWSHLMSHCPQVWRHWGDWWDAPFACCSCCWTCIRSTPPPPDQGQDVLRRSLILLQIWKKRGGCFWFSFARNAQPAHLEASSLQRTHNNSVVFIIDHILTDFVLRPWCATPWGTRKPVFPSLDSSKHPWTWCSARRCMFLHNFALLGFFFHNCWLEHGYLPSHLPKKFGSGAMRVHGASTSHGNPQVRPLHVL